MYLFVDFIQQTDSAADLKVVSHDPMETSPISSRTSSPDSQRRSSRHDSIGSSMSGGSFNTPQTNFLQKQKEIREQQQHHQVPYYLNTVQRKCNDFFF